MFSNWLGIVLILINVIMLGLLWSITNRVIRLEKAKRRSKKKTHSDQPIAAAGMVDGTEEDEIYAVIAAAVAAMETDGQQYAIRSYRRIGRNTPLWNERSELECK